MSEIHASEMSAERGYELERALARAHDAESEMAPAVCKLSCWRGGGQRPCRVS
jgi:hypothetical protein